MAIEEVLENPEYMANAEKIKRILSDQPIKSKDLFLYWVNYTIRHNGAKHLISQVPFELNIFQYWSVDVIAFLALTLASALLLLVLALRFVSTKIVFKAKNKKKRNVEQTHQSKIRNVQ